MQINQDDKFWVVTNPKRGSELADILFDTTIEGLERQFKGGLTSDENPAIFTDHKEAELEANRRLMAVKVARAVIMVASAESMKKAKKVEFKSATGVVVFSVDL